MGARRGAYYALAMPRLLGPAVALALLLGAASSEVRAEVEQDPAHIAGTWQYRTRSNCGRVEGVGRVTWTWDAARGLYRERGSVYWADSGLTVRWWGFQRYDPESRRLSGRVSNSLGDTVDGWWRLEGDGPDRAVVEWNQTNGCHGVGTATR